MAPANRRLTEQEKVCARLRRLGWKQTDATYYRKGRCRVIVGGGEVSSDADTLLTCFSEADDRRPEWEITFGPNTPHQIVTSTCTQAAEAV